MIKQTEERYLGNAALHSVGRSADLRGGKYNLDGPNHGQVLVSPWMSIPGWVSQMSRDIYGDGLRVRVSHSSAFCLLTIAGYIRLAAE